MVRDLLQASGHEVALAARRPVGARRGSQAREPDLLILDVSMPGMTGLRGVPRGEGEPVHGAHPGAHADRGGATSTRKVEGFEAGADDYLAKPFDPRELRARVTALVRLVRREGDRNPTSGLPGGRAIERRAGAARRARRRRSRCATSTSTTSSRSPTSSASRSADAVIRDAGVALAARRWPTPAARSAADGDFVGHIGGDDFLVVSRARRRRGAGAGDAARRFRELIGGARRRARCSARGAFAGARPRRARCASSRSPAVDRACCSCARSAGARAATWARAPPTRSAARRRRGGGTILVEAV